MKNLLLMGCALLATCVTLEEVNAAEPGWSPVIVATGAYRQQLEKHPSCGVLIAPFIFTATLCAECTIEVPQFLHHVI